MNAPRNGFRGYIASRPIRHTSFPQRVQNAVVQSFAARRNLAFKLSLTEYAMPGCFMMLETLLAELPKLDGIIMFSMFMLPDERRERERIYTQILDGGWHLHAALEETTLFSIDDVGLFEDTIGVAAALLQAPLRGRFEKNGRPLPLDDPFVAQLKRALATS